LLLLVTHPALASTSARSLHDALPICLPADCGSGRPNATPCPSPGMARRPISGHPLSTQSATSGSATRSPRVSSSERHRVGRTKIRSWRRIGRSSGLECETTDALRDIGRLQSAAPLLAERIPAVARVWHIAEECLQLVDQRDGFVPSGVNRSRLSKISKTGSKHRRGLRLFLQDFYRQLRHLGH